MWKMIQRLCGEEKKLLLQFTKSGLVISSKLEHDIAHVAYLLCVHLVICAHATDLDNKDPREYAAVDCLVEKSLLLAVHCNKTERTDSLPQLIKCFWDKFQNFSRRPDILTSLIFG